MRATSTHLDAARDEQGHQKVQQASVYACAHRLAGAAVQPVPDCTSSAVCIDDKVLSYRLSFARLRKGEAPRLLRSFPELRRSCSPESCLW